MVNLQNNKINPNEIEKELENFDVEEEKEEKKDEKVEKEEEKKVEKFNENELLEKIEKIRNEEKLKKIKKEEEKEDLKKEEKKDEEIDYKARYVGSTKEAMVLTERNKFYREAVKKAEEIKDVSNEELIKEYGEERYAEADDEDLKIMKENLILKKRQSLINEAIKKDEEVESWINKVRDFVRNDEIKEKYGLEGFEDEFTRFALMPSRIGLDLENLVKIFLFDNRELEKRHKGQLLLQRKRSVVNKEETKISVEEAGYLRRKNPRLYKEMVRLGKIDIDIE